MWEYKKTGYKKDGLTVYKAFAFGEFSHYCYRQPVYQLQQKRTLKGIELREIKLKGVYQYQYFYRCKNKNGIQETWDQWLKQVKQEMKERKELEKATA